MHTTTQSNPQVEQSSCPAPPPNVVSVRNLWVRYGKLEAVRGISFNIPRGEVFGFIGPNGAGKSSTIRVLASLQTKYDGQALINGVNVRTNPDRVREMMGYMPDFSACTRTSRRGNTCIFLPRRTASRSVAATPLSTMCCSSPT